MSSFVHPSIRCSILRVRPPAPSHAAAWLHHRAGASTNATPITPSSHHRHPYHHHPSSPFSSQNHDSSHHHQPTSRVSKGLDYYTILEVNRYQLREGDLKQSYHRLAKQYHPDRLIHLTTQERQRAEKHFAQIGVAYSVLSHPQKRQQYDIFMDLSSIGDQDRMLHWVAINRPPEQLGFQGFAPAYEKGYKEGDTMTPTTPTPPPADSNTTPTTNTTDAATSTKPAKPKVVMPVFRSS